MRRTTKRRHSIFACPDGKAKVYDLEVPIAVQHDVVWFQVSVNDSNTVHKLYGHQDLCPIEARLAVPVWKLIYSCFCYLVGNYVYVYDYVYGIICLNYVEHAGCR